MHRVPLWAVRRAESGPGVASQKRGRGLELVSRDGESGISSTVVPTEQLLSLVLLPFFFFLSFLSKLKLFCLQSFGGCWFPQCQASGWLPLPFSSYKGYRDLDSPVQRWRTTVHGFLGVTCRGGVVTWQSVGGQGSGFGVQTSSGCVTQPAYRLETFSCVVFLVCSFAAVTPFMVIWEMQAHCYSFVTLFITVPVTGITLPEALLFLYIYLKCFFSVWCACKFTVTFLKLFSAVSSISL